jgi:transcriptional regulator with XRE-family HTH domain
MTGGILIREARRRAGMTQAELAGMLGTTQSVVARWETGGREPSMATVARVVRASGHQLDVSITPRDDDHDRLISDMLVLLPADRIRDLVNRVGVERRLHGARRT